MFKEWLKKEQGEPAFEKGDHWDIKEVLHKGTRLLEIGRCEKSMH